MEPLEFLGGKYQQATQILPGTLQTFRAVDSSAGRDVFVHRVPANDPAAHQLALLLSTALIRSAKARKMVLDVVEADGFAYVVTDTEHQCLLLREWLQFEINQASGADASARPPASPPPAPVVDKQPSLEDTDPKMPTLEAAAKPQPPPSPEPAKPEPGEFTRMFMAGTTAAQKDIRPAAEKPPTAAPAAEKPAAKPATQPGEFTMFMAGTGPAQKETQPAAETLHVEKPATDKPAEKPPAEAGEFTRFFQTANPPEKKSAPEPPRTPERPMNPDFGRTGFVQRPNSPLPTPSPTAQKPNEPGEFTRMFMQGGFTPTPAPAQAPIASPPTTPRDPFAPAPGGGMFSEPTPATPQPSAKPMGEYTRIFGSGTEAPPVQQPSTVAAPPPPLTDDPLLRSGGPVPQTPASAPQPPARGPSEYTLVMSGRSSEAATTNAPNPAAPGAAGPATPAAAGMPGFPPPQVKMNVTPPNPMQGLHVPPPPAAHAGGGGMSASSPIGSASAHVAGPNMPAPPHMNVPTPAGFKMPAPPATVPAKNNKLIILFIVLGVLAILLVVLIVLLLKK